MRSRRLGRTGLSVSEITFGTGPWERPAFDLDEASAAMAMAIENGVDAVELEVDGPAIEALSVLLERTGARRRIHVLARLASRIPFDLPSPHVHVQQAFPGQAIRAQAERMLKALGVERLGLLQIHAWCPEWLDEGDWLETLGRLREEGKLAGIGVSLFDHDVDAGLEVVASGAIDCIQVMLNVFDQGAAAALLPLCRRNDIGVIARSPLYFGALADAAGQFAPGDWRREYFFAEHLAETRARVGRLLPNVEPRDGQVAETALRFALSHAVVSTVAVGMRTRAQVAANLCAAEQGPLSPESLAALRGHKWLC